jgi:hypothetical protein
LGRVYVSLGINRYNETTETKGNKMDSITKRWRDTLIAVALGMSATLILGYVAGKQAATAEIRVELLPCG